jgi:hypothetical protein
MIAHGTLASSPEPSLMRRRFVRPPKMCLLPSRRTRSDALLASFLLHAFAIAALIVLRALFPAPIVVADNLSKPVVLADFEPLPLPQLPEIKDSGSGSMQSQAATAGAGSGPARPLVEPPLPVPDYTRPQAVISFVPNPINRVQTILRPDLVKPPQLRFPLRLPSMVVLPAAAPPVVKASLREEPKQAPAPVAEASEEVPVAKATVQTPVLTLTPKRASMIRSQPAPAKAISPDLKMFAGSRAKALKAIVVVNAVNVAPDPSAAVPDAQLAGLFVVGPSRGASETESSSGSESGASAKDGPSNGGERSAAPAPAPATDKGIAASSGNGGAPAAGSGSRAEPGSGTGSGKRAGNEPAVGAIGASGMGGGTGPGPAPGPGSGSGTSGHGTGSGVATGISISGGVPGRNGATIAKSVPQSRSYGMMIISGGSSGGASRDLGVFGRSETVYSVSIPMAGAGGGSDWSMQYALLNPAQAGAGLLVPPFVQKKVAATMARSQLTGDPGPVFVTGIIDENGKLQFLRAIRAQDPRSQAAVLALQQWEFLPAQLDGKPVPSKVLIGVTITAAE